MRIEASTHIYWIDRYSNKRYATIRERGNEPSTIFLVIRDGGAGMLSFSRNQRIAVSFKKLERTKFNEGACLKRPLKKLKKKED
jgi:hypothetical protein